MRSSSKLLIAIGFTVLFFTACSRISGKKTQEEIRIGIILTMSGEFAKSSGTQVKTAVELYDRQISQQGGLMIGGRKMAVKFFYADDQDNPQSAVAAAQKLINQDSVVAIIGATKSRLAIPVAALAESLKIVYISPTSSNPVLTKDKQFVFRATFTDPVQGMAIARFARTELKAKSAAVLYDDASSYNKGLAENFKTEFVLAGGKISSYQKFVTGDLDFSKQFTEISKNPPDVLFLPNYFNEVSIQADLVKKHRLRSILLGGDAWSSLPDSLVKKLEGSYFCSAFSASQQSPSTKLFVDQYTKAGGPVPQHTAALSYDAIQLLIEAIRLQGSIDPLRISAGIRQIKKFQGVAGTYSFSAGGDPQKPVNIMKISGGRAVVDQQFKP